MNLINKVKSLRESILNEELPSKSNINILGLALSDYSGAIIKRDNAFKSGTDKDQRAANIWRDKHANKIEKLIKQFGRETLIQTLESNPNLKHLTSILKDYPKFYGDKD